LPAITCPTSSLIIKVLKVSNRLRNLRGRFYRLIPAGNRRIFIKKLTGFERRWKMESVGFTKEGFFGILHEKLGLTRRKGQLVELGAGDGLVGSLGFWLETRVKGWKVMAWEHRPHVFEHLRQNRPDTEIHKGRLVDWMGNFHGNPPTAITTRGAREASGVCRAIRKKLIRPDWLGIWNPSRRPVWFRRLNKQRYRMELVWHNMEFYRRRQP
jgi:hypothetical protein